MADEGSKQSSSVSDGDIRGMVTALEPEWRVETIDRSAHGTDFVAVLSVTTPEGPREVVLKAVTAEHMPVAAGRAEPRFLELAAEETTIPVPTVFGYVDDHPAYPSPFFLMEYVEGENHEGREQELSPGPRERIVRDAGRYLAELHDCGPVSGVGRMGYVDGELRVIDPAQRDLDASAMRDVLLDEAEVAVESFESGGYFPEFAENPERFADLVEPIREHLREAIPRLSDLDPVTYSHNDYRYGNLLVGSAGETRAVIDWGNLSAWEPAYNIAYTESMLLSPEQDGEERTTELREAFRSAYTSTREEWTFDAARRERIRLYRLLYHLDAMACLPLWHQDASPEEKDEREREHREFVRQFL